MGLRDGWTISANHFELGVLGHQFKSGEFFLNRLKIPKLPTFSTSVPQASNVLNILKALTVR